VLEDFLEKFSGCLLLVSHDRYFMDHLVDQLFIFEGDGKIRQFNGNYTDYRDAADEEEALAEKEPKPTQVPAAQPKSGEKKKASFKEKQEYENLQSEIDQLEKKKQELSGLLVSGSTDHVQLNEWGQEIEKINKAIENKTMRWLELSELI
jgi:ATP-binding cassette subfamily F protein uup